MAAIPGWVYIAIGFMMSAVSGFVKKTTDNNSLNLFFWLGLAFIGIGIIKIIMPKPTAKHTVTHHHQSHHKHHQNSITHCPRCRTPHYPNANFCTNCGVQLKEVHHGRS